MDNSAVSGIFSLLAKLMEVHGENSFKAKTYANTAFALDRLPIQLTETPREKWAAIKGIGDSSAKKIEEILSTGSLQQLEELREVAPLDDADFEAAAFFGAAFFCCCHVHKNLMVSK